jgi:anti-sigma regulatory factor (Ser/Thr protein kinase)
LARDLGFDDGEVGRVAIAVTEAATNLVKHAGGGTIALRKVERAGHVSLGFIAIDRGPGMRDARASLVDGHSTVGTPGTGLGAIARQSTEFDLYSSVGHGTAISAEFRRGARADSGSRDGLKIGGVSVPHPGEDVCGDRWAAFEADGIASVLLADGLGHGAPAAEAARTATDVFRRHARERPQAIIERAHDALRATRGAAAAVAQIDARRGLLHFCGIGNVSGTVLSGEATRSMVSHHGTLGHDVRRIREFSVPWPSGGALVLHSDGLTSRWTLAPYPGLLRHHPTVVAAVLYRDFTRGHDDASVVVLREAA